MNQTYECPVHFILTKAIMYKFIWKIRCLSLFLIWEWGSIEYLVMGRGAIGLCAAVSWGEGAQTAILRLCSNAISSYHFHAFHWASLNEHNIEKNALFALAFFYRFLGAEMVSEVQKQNLAFSFFLWIVDFIYFNSLLVLEHVLPSFFRMHGMAGLFHFSGWIRVSNYVVAYSIPLFIHA